MTLFSACQIIHTCYEQNERLKQSMNYFCAIEFFKYVINGKVDINFRLDPREKSYSGKIFLKTIFSLNCV